MQFSVAGDGRVTGFFGRRKRVEGLVGLSLADSHIALAHVSHRNGEPLLERCVRQPIDKPAAVSEQLARLVDAQDLNKAPCSYVLSPADYNVYLVEAPAVESAEMAAAVRWKVKDLLDMPVDDAVIDVFPLPDDAFQGRNKMLYAVVAARPQIERVIELVDRAGMVLDTIDIPEMALRNIGRHFLDDRNGLALLSLKRSGSTLNISRGGRLYLTRRINTSVAPDALMQNDWELVRDRLVLEIQRSLDYFESQMGQNPVAQIMMAPREHDTASIMNALADALAAPVGMADFVSELPAYDDISAEDKIFGMISIGAALRIAAEGIS